MMKKATIILPVYNGEAFLRRSVKSVFSQTYVEKGGRIELIAVNDGSTDGSLRLLRRLKKVCPPQIDMRVFDQENAGICAARSRGLDLATGSYVLFMDQDDCMKRDCVEALASSLEREGADMVIGGYALVDGNGRILESWRLDSRLPWNKYRISAPWGRIFRREIIEENHIRFVQTKISEDFYFNLVYMSYCRKIFVTPYIGYAWTFRAASESHTGMRRQEEDRNPLPMMSHALQDMKKPNGLEPELVEYMFVKHLVWYLLYTARGTPPEKLAKSCGDCFSFLRERFPKYDKNEELRAGGPRGESLHVRAVVRAAVLLQKKGLFLPLLKVYSRH